MEEDETFVEKARRLIFEYHDNTVNDPDWDNIRVVWFCKTLQNWKAMVANVANNGEFYEVTYNGNKQETYIDVYRKINNVVVTD